MLNVIEDIFMVNQINDSAKIKPLDSDSRLKTNQQDNQTRTENIAEENVSLSPTSKQLRALKATLKDIPEVDEARVTYFKNEIQAGNYQIDSEKIAKSMLNLELA